MGAMVKIMLSYDYCHFEVSKSTDQELTDQQIDEMRKDVQRLANKAVEQYKVYKKGLDNKISIENKREQLEYFAKRIRRTDEAMRTPKDKATLKILEDSAYWNDQLERYDFDFEDDFNEPEDFEFDDDDFEQFLEP